MKPEVREALAELRSEIDTLAASVLARSRFAAPEILTSRRVSFGSASAAVLTSEPTPAPRLPDPPVMASMQASVEQRMPVALSSAPTTVQSEPGFVQRFIAVVRRIIRRLAG